MTLDLWHCDADDSMIKLLSRIPCAALYAFAGFLYFLAYHVVRHRRHVIVEQLEKVYPDASVAQRETIHKQFLRNYCDVMIEVLKSVSMSEAEMRQRMRVTNLEVARRYLDAGQSIMFVTSHLGNWEWLLHGVTLQLGYPVDAAYKPLHDAWAERLMLGSALAVWRAAGARQGAAGGHSCAGAVSHARSP